MLQNPHDAFLERKQAAPEVDFSIDLYRLKIFLREVISNVFRCVQSFLT